MAKYRQERVASEILHELSGIILLEVKDPRVHDITLTDVTMSSDLSVASVRYFCAEGVDKDEVQKGIEHVMPFLRRAIGERIELRRVPDLHFYYDKGMEHSARVEALFAKLHAEGQMGPGDPESDK